MTPLLSTAFCPPIEYFAVLAGYSSVYMEASESYVKQSWRNRCRLLTANGPQDFTVPVVHPATPAKMGIGEVRVEYSTPWVAKFEKAVESAYGSSPYYIYYADEFFAILDSRPTTRWELNAGIISWLCRRIGIAPEIIPTTAYYPVEAKGSGFMDLRETIHPKRPNSILVEMGLGRPYWQVFRERFGFTPGLSVLDLLFNEGPETIGWLR